MSFHDHWLVHQLVVVIRKWKIQPRRFAVLLIGRRLFLRRVKKECSVENKFLQSARGGKALR